MASSSLFSVHQTLTMMIIIMAFMPSPRLSSPSIPKLPTLSSSPATTLTNPSNPSSLTPSIQQLSPDIAPLFPSPGGVFPTPASGSDIPTIPSSPSTPNPDDIFAPGPLSAFSPMQASSNAPPRTLVSVTAAFAGLAAACYYWSMQHM